MKRKIGLVWSVVLLLAVASAALAGGWAVVTLDEPAGEIRAGEPWTVGFTVLQHGKTPVHKLDANSPVEPLLVAEHSSGRRLEIMATPGEEVGHFTIDVTFPVEGEWTWTIFPNPLAGETAFEPLTVLPAAPVASGQANAQTVAAPAATESGVGLPGALGWGALALVLVAVAAHLFLSRRRPIPRPQGGGRGGAVTSSPPPSGRG